MLLLCEQVQFLVRFCCQRVKRLVSAVYGIHSKRSGSHLRLTAAEERQMSDQYNVVDGLGAESLNRALQLVVIQFVPLLFSIVDRARRRVNRPIGPRVELEKTNGLSRCTQEQRR